MDRVKTTTAGDLPDSSASQNKALVPVLGFLSYRLGLAYQRIVITLSGIFDRLEEVFL